MTKALEMTIARDLKAHRHWRLCLKCGHMNNGETEIWKRICRCAEPVLCPQGKKEAVALEEFRSRRKDEEEAWQNMVPVPGDEEGEL